MNTKRKRVKAYVDAISELILSKDWSREKAVELVKRNLESTGVEPFRGASKPEDIYDKELISLFIVGTRGLGINKEFEGVFKEVFSKEMKYEAVIKALESDQPVEQVRTTIKSLFPELSENDVARILRFAVTLYYLDFKPYDFVTKVIRRLNEALPEYSETIRRFTRFFIAIKLAEEIFTGNIKTKVDKEIRKQVISLETGIERSTPSDDYVRKVAQVAYEIPEQVLRGIFTQKEGKRDSRG